MKKQFLVGVMLGVAAMIGAAKSASAQAIGVGGGVLGDYGGPGAGFVYNSANGPQASRPLGWIADVAIFPAGGSGSVDFKTFLAQFGVQTRGAAGDKVDWLLHGLVGIRHSRASADGLLDAICQFAEVDCSANDTGGVITVGGGIDFALSEKNAVRAQLDIPISIGDDGGSTTRFMVYYIMKMGR